MKKTSLWAGVAFAAALVCTQAGAQLAGADAAVQRAAAAQKQRLLDTLKELVHIETGSRDLEGLTRATELIGSRLRALGAQVDFIEPAEADVYRMADTPPKPGRMAGRRCATCARRTPRRRSGCRRRLPGVRRR